MSALTKKKFYTPEEYLEIEDNSDSKNEYDNGVIIPIRDDGNYSPEIIGATINHVQITANITAILSPVMKKQGYSVLTNDLKVWIDSIQKFYYPDISVICGKLVYYNEKRTTIENPKLITEVLSKSTEAKDRGKKFFDYRTLKSFEEYVLVSQDKILVETFTRQTDESWKYLATIGIESKVNLESLNVELNMRDVYDSVEFEIEESDEL